MKVNISSLLFRGRGKRMWNAYAAAVTDIQTSGKGEYDCVFVTGSKCSRVEAEIVAEVFQHYIDTFPGAEGRLRQAANAPFNADMPLVAGKD